MSLIKIEIKLPEAHKVLIAFSENRLLALEKVVLQLLLGA